METNQSSQRNAWRREVYDVLKRNDIRQIAYVPDAGHATAIQLAQEDPDMIEISLTTEEEGIALAAGAWLGGHRSAVLMQSSGVGNCINMLSLVKECQTPLILVVTMRGEFGEQNGWQIPMGSVTEQMLKLCGLVVYRVDHHDDVGHTLQAAINVAYEGGRGTAVILSQKMIGAKEVTKNA